MFRILAGSGLVLTAVASLALAETPDGVQTYTIAPSQSNCAYIVRRPVVDTAATVSRALADQPTRPWEVEVRVSPGGVVYLDPNVEYIHNGNSNTSIDENQYIPRAQRLAATINSPGATIVWGSAHHGARAAGEIRPRFIITKPGAMPGNDGDQQAPMPSVPEPPAPQKSVAMAK